MKETTDPKRNRPSNIGPDNDPNMRDESALQPGASTISRSGTDDVNNQVTGSAMNDGSDPTNFDTERNADPAFDDTEKDI